jgi:hypothetical protein
VANTNRVKKVKTWRYLLKISVLPYGPSVLRSSSSRAAHSGAPAAAGAASRAVGALK